MPFGGQLPQLKPGQWAKLAVGAVVVIGLLWGVVTCFYTVGADSEAVVLRFGRYRETAGPGLHFKLPFGMDRQVGQIVRVIVPVVGATISQLGGHHRPPAFGQE